MHLLIIEDDLDLGQALQRALKSDGLTSEWIRRVGDVPHCFNGHQFDCILLDLGLPDGSGMELLTRWRTAGIGVPIIVITARAMLEDRIEGLDGGADDFIVKPFATAELVSRIRAVVRRYSRQSSELWSIGELEIAPRKYEAHLNSIKLELSPREFRLLLELAREPGSVVPKHVLSQRLEPLGDPVDAGTIEVHISNLRRKIGAQRIETVRGIGYLLAA